MVPILVNVYIIRIKNAGRVRPLWDDRPNIHNTGHNLYLLPLGLLICWSSAASRAQDWGIASI